MIFDKVCKNETCFSVTRTDYTNESLVFTEGKYCVNSCSGYTTSVIQMDCVEACPTEYSYYINTAHTIYNLRENKTGPSQYSTSA